MRAIATVLSVLSGLLVLTVASPASADPDVAAGRIAGADRFDTAAKVAELTFDAQATSSAVLAAAGAFPDAVTGVGVASAAVGPVLLTHRDEVPERTRAALDALTVTTVYLVGGEGVISAAVADELAQDFEVRRIAGADRYATAAEVARFMAATGQIGSVDGEVTALLATGRDFPDALTGGPLAYVKRLPVLLTEPDDLVPQTAAALDELGVQRVLVLGGTSSVSEHVVEHVRERGITVERIAGQDRTGTAAEMARVLSERFAFSSAQVLLSRGDDFPDSLAAGPRGGELRVPVLLTQRPDALGAATGSWLAGECPQVERVQAVGGTQAVQVRTLSAAVDAAESCEPPQRRITYTTGTRGEVTADFPRFQEIVAATLEDDRGWDLGGDLEYTEVDSGGDFRLWLADPQAVDDAATGCSAYYSCQVGDDVYINETRWENSTTTYNDRPKAEYRSYVINHEVGHWLGLGHRSCPGTGRPAPVMQQQSKSLDGCVSNVWPLPAEQQAVRDRWLG